MNRKFSSDENLNDAQFLTNLFKDVESFGGFCHCMERGRRYDARRADTGK
jgi:hypothetical protein